MTVMSKPQRRGAPGADAEVEADAPEDAAGDADPAARARARLRRAPLRSALSSSAGCCSPRTTFSRSPTTSWRSGGSRTARVFGNGVVCGLDVSCDPCDVGSVVVGPGYALDCCGNDIVVSCPETLDVLALVRELRDRTGVDCGEPCDDQPCQTYVLNVLYAEEPTDPVAPYDQDDCAVGDCQFSRVREGYRFELSCEAAELEPTVIDKLRECFGVDDRKVREKAAAMTRVVQLAKAHQGEALAEAEVAIPRKEEFDRLEGARSR